MPAFLTETGRGSQDGVHVTRLLWRLLEIQLQTRDFMLLQSQSLTFTHFSVAQTCVCDHVIIWLADISIDWFILKECMPGLTYLLQVIAVQRIGFYIFEYFLFCSENESRCISESFPSPPRLEAAAWVLNNLRMMTFLLSPCFLLKCSYLNYFCWLVNMKNNRTSFHKTRYL